jgi:hypothetical protein
MREAATAGYPVPARVVADLLPYADQCLIGYSYAFLSTYFQRGKSVVPPELVDALVHSAFSYADPELTENDCVPPAIMTVLTHQVNGLVGLLTQRSWTCDPGPLVKLIARLMEFHSESFDDLRLFPLCGAACALLFRTEQAGAVHVLNLTLEAWKTKLATCPVTSDVALAIISAFAHNWQDVDPGIRKDTLLSLFDTPTVESEPDEMGDIVHWGGCVSRLVQSLPADAFSDVDVGQLFEAFRVKLDAREPGNRDEQYTRVVPLLRSEFVLSFLSIGFTLPEGLVAETFQSIATDQLILSDYYRLLLVLAVQKAADNYPSIGEEMKRLAAIAVTQPLGDRDAILRFTQIDKMEDLNVFPA